MPSTLENMRKLVLLYRGPLERARLAFIIEALQTVGGEHYFVWIYPGKLNNDKNKIFTVFMAQYNFKQLLVLDEMRLGYFKCLSRVRSFLTGMKSVDAALIGFSAPMYTLACRTKYVWFINGIPEEEELATNGAFGRLKTFAKWSLVRLTNRARFIVTVSERMNRYVNKHIPSKRTFAAPTCVDVTTFDQRREKKGYYTYLGSGASWQALDVTSQIWQELYALQPTAKFRVISRDPRSRILGKNIPSENIEFVASDDFADVANYLSECSAGFLIRRDLLVNRVSFPTKLGEYVASRCWVVASDLDWDISDYVRKYNIGVIIPPDASPREGAEKILEFQATHSPGELLKNLEQCTPYLGRHYWIGQLRRELEATGL